METRTKHQRWPALDMLKALGVFIMIVSHSLIWWVSEDDTSVKADEQKYFESLGLGLVVMSFFPLSIPITAGAAFYFFMERKKKETTRLILVSAIKKSLLLILLGFGLNILTWGVDNAFAWDVLGFVAICIGISAIILRILNIWVMYLLGMSSLLFAPILREFFGGDTYIQVILFGDYGNNFWPLFPWLGIYVLGMGVAHLKKNVDNDTFWKIGLIVGISLFTVDLLSGDAFFRLNPSNIWGPEVFQPPTEKILGLMGVFLILIVFIDRYAKKDSPFNIVGSFSKGIMYIYLAHIIGGFRLIESLKVSHGVEFLVVAIAFQLFAAYCIGYIVILMRKKGFLRWY